MIKTFPKFLKFFIDLRFAIFLLLIIALLSSIGSIIEQNESLSFYEEKYKNSIYGIINSSFILKAGLNNIYSSWYFLFLLFSLAFSLLSCTFIRQFPLVKNSKIYFFKQQVKNLPFYEKITPSYYFIERILLKFTSLDFFIYQKKNFSYAYKGLIGRLSPVLVHLSLLIILTGGLWGAFDTFKAEESVPKGEIFRIQNLVKSGDITKLPSFSIRLNDFWIDYKNKKISQFYSNLSILDTKGKEVKQETISVNNPLRYKKIDFYQSDWNLIGLRLKKQDQAKFLEYPLFSLVSEKTKGQKTWITWVEVKKENYTILLSDLSNQFFFYSKNGDFLGEKTLAENLTNSFFLLEVLPSTGLVIKYDPSIFLIYSGFAGLIITTFLSYLPYTQFWLVQEKSTDINSQKFHRKKKNFLYLASSTNRGKIQLEIQFENILRMSEKVLSKNSLELKKVKSKKNQNS